MDWQYCIRKRIAKEVKIDSDLIKSLIKTSENKLQSEGKIECESYNKKG